MWIYKQATGELFRNHLDSPIVGVGYAGKDEGKNNTKLEAVRNTGPLPRGLYAIGSAYLDKTRGSYCMALLPDRKNVMYGRSGFLIHADSIAHPGSASEGCIVLALEVRKLIATSDDCWLVVI